MPDVFGASGQFSIDALNNQAQNNINNLYTGGGFGAQTNYYSQLGANYSAQVPMSWENPYAGGGVPASLAYPGASLSGGYTTGVANMPHFDAGPNFGFTSGGAGGYAPSVNNPSINWSQFSGGLGGGGAQPSIDWSTFQSPPNNYSSFQMPSASQFGGGMFGGLTGSGGGYQGPNNAIDWPNLFQPSPNVPQQQAPAIDWNSFQSPSNSYKTFQGAGIQAPDPTPQSQAQPPYDFSPAPKLPDAQKLLGYDPNKGFSAGGAQQPATPDQGMDPNYWATTLGAGSEPAGTHVYDLAPMFESGGGGKFGAGGGDVSGASDVKSGSLGGDAFTFNPGAYRFDPVADKGPESAGASADDMAAQARGRLASLMGGATPEQAAETAKAVDADSTGMRDFQSPEQGYGRFQQPATPRTGYKADLDFLTERGGHNSIVMDGRIANAPLDATGNFKQLSPELAARLASAARDYESSTGQRANFGEFSRGSDVQKIYWDRYQAGTGGIAAPPGSSRHQAGNAGDIGRGDFRDWLQANGDTYGVNFPVRGDPVHVQMDPAHTQSTFAEPDSAPRPQADIPYPQGIPLPAERPAEAGARPEVAAEPLETRPGVNQGQDITPPPASIPDSRVSDGGFNALDAAANAPPAPVKHTGLELARANIDTPIEKIAMERGGQKAVDQISFMAMGKTPRELAQSYGSMFFSNAEPLFKSLGITRQDFDKAAASPQTKQDIKMRFAGGDDYAPAVLRENAPDTPFSTGWSPYPGFRDSGNVEDRRDEQLTPDELSILQRMPFSYEQGAEVAPTALSGALGLGDLPMPQGMTAASARPQGIADNAGGSTFDERFGGTPDMANFQSPEQDYSMFQQPASRADLAKTMTFGGGFSPSPEPRQGGVGPQAALEPDFMDVIKEVESSGNPDKVTGSYKGLYQLDDKEFRKYGGTGSIFDPEENTKAASAKMVDETQRVQDILGRALTPSEQYMVHQQGVAGSLAHLANPDELAWKNFQGASGWKDARAKEAIWGNMTPEMQKQFGDDVNNVTSRDFLRLWDDRYHGILNR